MASQLGDPNPVSDSAIGSDEEEEDYLSVVKGGYTALDDEDDPVDYETTCPGQSFTKEQEEKIYLNCRDRYIELCVEFGKLMTEMERQGDAHGPFPPKPLKVLPETTELCIDRGYCYHREYMTNNTCQTESTLGLSGWQIMLQICSVRLSTYKSESYPISIYGIFAVRDELESLRNYVFNRSRDNPVIIHQDVFSLPLCSPCRGMYIVDRALLEVDLWVKKEGDRSNDEKLLSSYTEINVRTCFDKMVTGRIHSDHCFLDMDYIFMNRGIEAVIQVWKTTDDPRHVRFSAFSRCFDFGIELFEGRCVEKGLVFQHVVVVKAEEKLVIRLESDNSHFEWAFQDGAVNYPVVVDSIFHQFYVRVFFAPKKGPFWLQRSGYRDWKERCRNKGSAGLLR